MTTDLFFGTILIKTKGINSEGKKGGLEAVRFLYAPLCLPTAFHNHRRLDCGK